MRYLLLCCLISFQASAQNNPAVFVNPFVGTAGHGHTYPGATLPFGMVQVSPDTRIDGSWDGCSGYHYSDNTIYGFSHTHLSGTGCSDYGDIMLMPITGEASFDNKLYSAKFNHSNESASPGYYSVKFDNGIKTELTATTRVGFHKYLFPTAESSVILDLTHRDQLTEGNIQIINDSCVAVKRISKAWASHQNAYAYIIFSKPFTVSFNAEKTKAIFKFNLPAIQELLVKVGFSFVSEAGAKINLDKELAGWDFEKTKLQAHTNWNTELNKIEAKDPDNEKMRTFYTALYHVMLQPNVAMDVDGNYRGMDNKIHKADNFTYYTVFSLWDTYRAAHPLYTMIEPERDLDFIKTFLKQYEQGGRLPIWELASNETDCMIGYHAASIIADAYAKGIRDFNVNQALDAMKKSATWKHLGIPKYMESGYLSIDDESESVSKTLEYAYDDWCIAQMANFIGSKADCNNYLMRSNAWRNLLDPETNNMRPRKNGGWLTPFDPMEVNNHFTEGNSWQYTFMVPQNINGLIKSMGGNEKFEAQLDKLFTASNKTTGRDQADITGLIGQYAHGNEPSHHIAYLYDYVGKPEKTSQRVHQILTEFYSSKPDGLIGNEDCGQMSAWYVMSSLGLYAVTPGSDIYALTKPNLKTYNLSGAKGKSFNIETINKALKKGNFISNDDLWGQKKSNLPTTNQDSLIYIPGPIFQASSKSFDDNLKIKITSTSHDNLVYYYIDEKGVESGLFDDSLYTLQESATFTGYASRVIDKKGFKSKPTYAVYKKTPHPNWKIELKSKYNSQYDAGGPKGIIDGIKGTVNWKIGDWQGYQGEDFEAIINLNEKKQISNFSGTFLQDANSWIMMPTKVEYYVSQDGNSFQLAATVVNTISDSDNTVQIKSFEKIINKPLEASFIKVKAYNYGKLPTWHAGAGSDAFIFVDELDFK